MVKRAPTPGPASSMGHQSIGVTSPTAATPYCLRGKSVDKTVPGGKQHGVPSGFVAESTQKKKSLIDGVDDLEALRHAPVNIHGIPSVQEMLASGYKATYNLKNPKYGVKGYNIQATYNIEPLYKPAKVAINKLDKSQIHVLIEKVAFSKSEE